MKQTVLGREDKVTEGRWRPDGYRQMRDREETEKHRNYGCGSRGRRMQEIWEEQR